MEGPASSGTRPPPHPPPIGRNFAVLSLGQVASRLLSFAVMVHLSRVLLAEGFGAVVLATAVLAYAALVVDLGFDSLGPLEMARGRIPPPDLARAVVTLRLLLTGPAFGALALFASLAPVSATTRLVILLYGLALLANAVDLGWVFLGTESMQPVAVAEMIHGSLLAVGAFLLVGQPDDVLRMPLLFAASRLAATAWLAFAFLRRLGRLRLGLDLGLIRRLLPAALPLSGATVVGTVLTNFDVVLLGLWMGTEAAGLYGAAYRLVWVPTMLATAYFMALRPAVARGLTQGLAAIVRLARASTEITAALGTGVVAAGILLAEPLIELFFGAGYRQAARPLQVLLGSFAFLLVSRLYRLVLVASGRQGTDLVILSTAAALNVGLNLWLIPRAGLIGAALATLASEGVVLLLGHWATRRLVGHIPFMPQLVRPAACAAPMILLLAATPSLALLPRLALGSAAYVALLLAFRVLDLRGLRALLSRGSSR